MLQSTLTNKLLSYLWGEISCMVVKIHLYENQINND